MFTVSTCNVRKLGMLLRAPTYLGDESPLVTPTRLAPQDPPVHTLVGVVTSTTPRTNTINVVASQMMHDAESHLQAWNNYNAKDMYSKWAVTRITILDLMARVSMLEKKHNRQE